MLGLLGGKVECLEMLSAAVAREILEQARIRIAGQRLLCVVDHLEAEMSPPQHWVSPTCPATIEQDEPRGMEPEAIAALGWFSLDALPAP